ncbi:hypothetical protein [Microcella sp.]|uniref:hypothetical protein n=1 Tax=Microcella sp. TaxID=1913979 RepID=UPI002568BE3C|nr:hypothetical protein [Microcella sp.]MBX9472046.1 hypothetical protein [Microcella sp.]
MTISRFVPLTLVALVSAAALTGCSIGDALNNERVSEFSTTTELSQNWERTAPWLPNDATGIRIRETPDAAPAVLLATSSADLDPSVCVETERLSGPVFSVDGAPNPYTDSAYACGDWTVIPSADGWYGWTPNHPDEQAEAERIE